MKGDFYARLGVSRDASEAEIAARFRELAKKHHPDVAGSASAEHFKLLSEAYETLCDAARRRAYNERLGAFGSSGEQWQRAWSSGADRAAGGASSKRAEAGAWDYARALLSRRLSHRALLLLLSIPVGLSCAWHWSQARRVMDSQDAARHRWGQMIQVLTGGADKEHRRAVVLATSGAAAGEGPGPKAPDPGA
eukprot:tig00021318_g20154.t1